MIRRRDVYFADLSPVVGSEQGGVRPLLIVQNNLGNHFSPTVIVVAITAKISKPKLPTHISLPASKSGLERDSVILTEQIRTIDKSRLKDKIYRIDDSRSTNREKLTTVCEKLTRSYMALSSSLSEQERLLAEQNGQKDFTEIEEREQERVINFKALIRSFSTL